MPVSTQELIVKIIIASKTLIRKNLVSDISYPTARISLKYKFNLKFICSCN